MVAEPDKRLLIGLRSKRSAVDWGWMRRGTLLTQVLLVNLLLIAAAVIAASIATNPENSLRDSATIGLVLGFALAADRGGEHLVAVPALRAAPAARHGDGDGRPQQAAGDRLAVDRGPEVRSSASSARSTRCSNGSRPSAAVPPTPP